MLNSNDIINLKRLFEEKDPFDSAAPEDVKARKDSIKANQEKKLVLRQQELGRKTDICPECFADLREVGVDQDETSYDTISMFHTADGWDFGKRRSWDSELRESNCPECEATLVRGRDWDVEGADNSGGDDSGRIVVN